jgi:hypothetical protein
MKTEDLLNLSTVVMSNIRVRRVCVQGLAIRAGIVLNEENQGQGPGEGQGQGQDQGQGQGQSQSQSQRSEKVTGTTEHLNI